MLQEKALFLKFVDYLFNWYHLIVYTYNLHIHGLYVTIYHYMFSLVWVSMT